jgi:hypothetical protein
MIKRNKRANTQKRGELFDWTPGHNNIVLNSMGDPEGEFGFYGDAFHRAGQALAERAAAEEWFHSLDACPIVFLYRQALELHFKSIIITGNAIFRIQGKAEPVDVKEIFKIHTLKVLLDGIAPIMEEMKWLDDFEYEGLKGWSDVEKIIKEFDAIDSGSYAFRYPVNKKGQGSVSHHFSFDVRIFVQKLDPLIKILSGANSGLDHTYTVMCDAYNEMHQEGADDYCHDMMQNYD